MTKPSPTHFSTMKKKSNEKEAAILPLDFEAAMRKIANAPKEDVERAIKEDEARKKKERERDCDTPEN